MAKKLQERGQLGSAKGGLEAGRNWKVSSIESIAKTRCTRTGYYAGSDSIWIAWGRGRKNW